MAKEFSFKINGAEYKCAVEEIEAGEKHVFNNSECGFAYRYSRFKGEWKGQYVVTAVTYRLSTQSLPPYILYP